MNQESVEFKATKMKAEQEDADAQNKLGDMYYFGKGVPKDYVEAAKWFHEAAEQGHADAQAKLGLMYAKDQGVKKDHDKAAKWFHKAAMQGHADAQTSLGGMYAAGVGVQEDYVEAYAWYLLAKTNGNKLAAWIIPIHEKRLTAEQIEKGQARAAELQRLIDAK